MRAKTYQTPDYQTRQSLDFTGQTALVLGASRGIGLASARVLAAYGAHVVLCARSEAAVREAGAGIRADGGRADARACDVTDHAAVARAVNGVADAHGLHILVNSAGLIEPLAPLHESDPDAWALAVDVNLKGPYNAMRAALPHMIKQGSGTVVNISSGAANSALVGWSHYCASKAGAAKLTAVTHKEVAAHGVRVVGLSPGTVATSMMATIRESGINAVSTLDWSRHIPPEWAGEAVAFLAGPEGGAFAGTDFSIKTEDGRARVGLPQEGAPDA